MAELQAALGPAFRDLPFWYGKAPKYYRRLRYFYCLLYFSHNELVVQVALEL